MNSLLELQRKMAKAVMQPLTASDSMRRIGSDGRRMAKVAAEFIKPNSRLTSFERLEIYNQQYWYRVRHSFAEDFPGLRVVVGKKRFEVLSTGYLSACPSQSFTLRNLGCRLTGWLQQNPAFAGPHFELAMDMARFEWAHIEAFDAAEIPPLTPTDAASLNGESRLSLQPHITFLELRFPVDDLLLALRKQHEDSELTGPARTRLLKRFAIREEIFLAVHRAENSVHYKRLEASEFRLLSALANGLSISEAIDSAFAVDPACDAEQYTYKVRQWFESWSSLAWLCPYGRNARVDWAEK